jgi:hypothetical protein
MTLPTQETVYGYIDGYHWLSNRIRKVGCVVADIRKAMYKHQAESCYEDYQIEAEEVTAHFSESCCSCCSNEEHYVGFPVSYLWTENYAEIETEAHAERLAKAERDAAAKKKRDEAAEVRKKEQKDLADFKRLKEKFKDLPNDTQPS